MVSAFVGDVVSNVSGNCRDTFVAQAEIGVVTAPPNCWTDAKENVFMFAGEPYKCMLKRSSETLAHFEPFGKSFTLIAHTVKKL